MNMAKRLGELERLAQVCADEVRALRVLIVDADDGTVTDAHTGETWPDLDAAPEAQIVIRLREEDRHDRTS